MFFFIIFNDNGRSRENKKFLKKYIWSFFVDNSESVRCTIFLKLCFTRASFASVFVFVFFVPDYFFRFFEGFFILFLIFLQLDGIIAMENDDTVPREVRSRRANKRDLISFWIFGLCNNYGYVVMLTAAIDIINHDNVRLNLGLNIRNYLSLICFLKF